MTPEQAELYARELYGDHPAAPALLMEAVHGATPERQRRSARALVALDPDNALPSALGDLAYQVSLVLLGAIYESDQRERLRLSGLLEALCTEASRLHQGTAA